MSTEAPTWRPRGVGSAAAATADWLGGLPKSPTALCLGSLNNRARSITFCENVLPPVDRWFKSTTVDTDAAKELPEAVQNDEFTASRMRGK